MKMQKLIVEGQAKMCNPELYRNILTSVTEDVEDMKDYGGVIVQEKNVGPIDGNIDVLLQKYEDFMSCEWYCNEFYIANELVENKWGHSTRILLECLQAQLCKKFPSRSFCVMISIDQGEFPSITAHCCQVRGDKFYFDSNLENYNQPVLYAVIGNRTGDGFA